MKFVINIINIYQHGIVLKDNVIASANNGYENLIKAGDEAKGAQFTGAQDSFAAAEKSFQEATDGISFLESNQNLFFTKEKTVQSAQGLLQAGKNISLAGQDFASGIEHLKELPALFLNQNDPTKLSSNEEKSNQDEYVPKESLTTKLKEDLVFLQKAQSEIELASQSLNTVSDDVLPAQFKGKLANARQSIAKILGLLQASEAKIPVILKLLGDRYLHRYLILLQNDTEARPTGGFIGSYLLVDINDGYIVKSEFHDVYETDGQLNEDIPAPEDIAKITKNWRLRDSNYSPDFAISAEKAAWFLQKEKGPSVDTVIAINQSIIADFLDLTGPITIDGVNGTFNKDNYQFIISYLVESKLSSIQDPKKILRSFIPAFQKQIFATKSWDKLLKVIINALQQKDILLYSRDTDIEKLFDEFGATGKTVQSSSDEDFLEVINTSIGGNKSDLFMNQDLKHTTAINIDGTVNDELAITRTHAWNNDVLKKWNKMLKSFGYDPLPDWLQSILGKGKNKSIVKVYVPFGSQLLSAEGAKVEGIFTRTDTEINKTYFMFEMDVSPGDAQTIKISYKLPQKLDLIIADTYKIRIQDQPGLITSSFEKKITTQSGISIYQKYPPTFINDENGNPTFKQDIKQDVYLSALLGK